MIIQFIASFIAVFCFTITLEIPKKFTLLVGVIGAIGWTIYLMSVAIGYSVILASFISALFVAIISVICSKIFHTVTTIFFIPGILPIVPGLAMYRTVYAMIQNNVSGISYYLMQTVLIAGGIALAIFITESIRDMKFIYKKGLKQNED